MVEKINFKISLKYSLICGSNQQFKMSGSFGLTSILDSGVQTFTQSSNVLHGISEWFRLELKMMRKSDGWNEFRKNWKSDILTKNVLPIHLDKNFFSYTISSTPGRGICLEQPLKFFYYTFFLFWFLQLTGMKWENFFQNFQK